MRADMPPSREASRLWEFLQGAARSTALCRRLTVAGALSGSEEIAFAPALLKTMFYATCLRQSRLTGLQLCLAVTPNHGDKLVR